jgi:transcription initiation factor TFIIH subunit 4
VSCFFRGGREHAEAVEALSGIRVWNEVAMPGGLPGWVLNHMFRHNLKIALLGG